jgi:hypothetical protein
VFAAGLLSELKGIMSLADTPIRKRKTIVQMNTDPAASRTC